MKLFDHVETLLEREATDIRNRMEAAARHASARMQEAEKARNAAHDAEREIAELTQQKERIEALLASYRAGMVEPAA